MESTKMIAMMSELEHIFHLFRGIPTNDQWKAFLQLLMGKTP
jgi:hypothetical protein